MYQGKNYPAQVISMTWQAGAAPPGDSTTGPSIMSANIREIVTHSGGATVFYEDPNNVSSNKKVLVTETAAALAAQTGHHVLVTPVDTSHPARYINTDRIHRLFDEGASGTKLIYHYGQQWRSLAVSETIASLIASINAAAATSGSFGTAAAAGTTQGTATLISDNYTSITSGTGGVRFPAAIVGSRYTIANGAAVAISVYPATGENFRAKAANEAIQLEVGESITVFSSVAGVWDSGDDDELSEGIVVAIAGTQATAAALPYKSNAVTGNGGVILPPATPGETRMVMNVGAFVINLYPAVGQAIGGLGNDNPLTLPQNQSVFLHCYSVSPAVWQYPQTFAETVRLETINEAVAGNGVTIDGVLAANGSVTANTPNNAGVPALTVDQDDNTGNPAAVRIENLGTGPDVSTEALTLTNGLIEPATGVAMEIQVADTFNVPALTLDQDDSTNNQPVLVIQNAGTGADIETAALHLTGGKFEPMAGAQFEIEVADTLNVPVLLLDQDDSTNNPAGLQIDNAGTGDDVVISRAAGTITIGGNQVLTARQAAVADVAAATAATITDNSGGVATQTIAAMTNVDSLTDSTSGTADNTVDDVSTAVTGVDGTANNAASKADVDTRLLAINNNFKELVDQVIAQQMLNTTVINAVASLADDLNKLNADVADIRTQVNALLATQRTHGLIAP